MFAAPSAPRLPAWATAMPAQDMGACQVTLIDRRTGRAHRISGAPLVRFTSDPRSAAQDLLAGRDPNIWEVRIEPLNP
jgi:hypothetical protein